MMTMKRTVMAAAVAGALAVPGLAVAQSTVEIYGRANLGIDQYRATGAPAGSAADFQARTRIYDAASRLGFRVNEGLGGGMRAFVVIETGINMDTGNTNGQSGIPNANTAGWASRDSYVGLGGGWGDVRFGRQSIYWSNGVLAQTGANYINAEVPWSSAVVLGRIQGPVARQPNVVSYNTPTIGGFNASLSYSPTSEAAAAGANTDGRVLGLTGRYTTGTLRAQFDWARNQGTTPTTAVPRTEVTGVKGGVGWAYAQGSQVSFLLGRVQNEGFAQAGFSAAGDRLKQSWWAVNWEHLIGPWAIYAQYGSLRKASGCSVAGGCDNTGARAYMIGTKYFLSKRTGVYASFNQTKNESNQIADYVAGGMSSAPNTGLIPGIAPGADPRIIAVGIMHNF